MIKKTYLEDILSKISSKQVQEAKVNCEEARRLYEVLNSNPGNKTKIVKRDLEGYQENF